jgi:osmotically-inducible protein OsmY
MRWMMAAGALVAVVGCGHTQSMTASRSSGEQEHDRFTTAFDQVRAGVEQSATAGKYTFVDGGDGVVKVTDESKQALERSRGDRVADAWIVRDVKARLDGDRSIDQTSLAVESSGGVVSLFGVVDDPMAAKHAIQLALDSDGVRAVDAELQLRQPAQ